MPPVEADDLPHSFDAEGARRIVNTVRWVESRPHNLRRDPPPREPFPPCTKFLTKNDSASTWNVGATVDVNHYAGATKGAETPTGLVIRGVYVRLGSVPVGNWAYVEDIQGIMEVWNAGPSC